jgi:glycosyltransferase involved in cell wall biosynthesis
MPPLRLLLVTHSLSGGGAERFASILATHFDRARFSPAVAAATARRSYPLPEDVAVTALGYRGLLTLPRTARRLRRLIESWGPDVVLSNVLSTNGLAGWALRGVSRPPAWVARIGNAPGLTEPALQRRVARRAYRRRAAALVCNSEGARAAFARCYPELAGLAEQLPNPTDFALLDRLAAEPAEIAGGVPALLWVGRLVRQKRPDLLIDAFSRVLPQAASRLVVCGDGPLRGAVERRARERGVSRAVELRGFVDNPFALMRRSDLFVMTSDFEGLPNALIEAQGLGLPAVATRCPHGVDEVIADGETGRLVEMDDAAGLAREIVALLAGAERRRAMAVAARQRARRLFALDSVLPRWQALLERAAATRGERPAAGGRP